MAIELKEVLAFTGIEAESIEDFKTNFEKTFLKKDAALKDEEFVKSVVGKRLHGVSNKLKNQLTKYGIEIPDKDVSEKKLEDLIEIAFDKYNDATNGTIAELTEKANKNSDTQSKELAEKLRKTEETNLALKAENKKLGLDLNDVKVKSAEELKGVRIQTIREQAMGKIPRRNDIEQKQYGLMLTGFENTIDSKFKIDLDENNLPFIADKKTGERFRDPAKAGEFLGIEDVLKKEAAELGISPKNPFQPPAQRPILPNGNGHQNGQPPAQERPRASRKV